MGDVIFCSGQVPIRPDGSLVDSDMGAMTRQVVANLERVLSAAGATLVDVVRTNVYLADRTSTPSVPTEQTCASCRPSSSPALVS